jgi:hypothetical protein
VALPALMLVAFTAAVGDDTGSATGLARASPPPPGGYFSMRPVGAWSALPTDAACRARVHRSRWEPRLDNDGPNHHRPRARAVHRALAARPVSSQGAYARRWDRWLLPRVDGQFTGTTDEIFQWAACKWGLPDDLLRAIAVRESTWYQFEVYPSGRPVDDFGSGDLVTSATRASRVFCNGLARHGRDYQRDYGTGRCPETFSIVGVMSWEAPSWGRMRANQNGTFPFSRDSTAFAVDYLGSQLRGCYEGWERWLRHTGSGRYSAGRIWGCVGAWYSGGWHDPPANSYIAKVQASEAAHSWLRSGWPDNRPGCSRVHGCPQGS